MTFRTPSLTRFAVALLLAGAVILFIALYAGPIATVAAHAGHGNSCGAMGTYGYTGFGTIFEGNALGFLPGTASTNGTITFDRNGQWTVQEVEVGNGVLLNPSAVFGGSFTLNSDCTFTATLPPLPGTALVGVLVDNGKEIRAISTIPGVQINYVSTKRVEP